MKKAIFLLSILIGFFILTFNAKAAEGDLIWSLISSQYGQAEDISDIAIDSSGVYVVGRDRAATSLQWRIEKRNLSNGLLVWSKSSAIGQGIASGVAVDSSGVYVASFDNSLGFNNAQLRIEKIDINTGNLISGFGNSGIVTSNISTGHDGFYDVAIDSNYLYAVGTDYAAGYGQWRIEKRNLSNGLLVWSKSRDFGTGQDIAFGVAVDSSGVYVAGRAGLANTDWRIEKLSLNGVLLWSKSQACAVLCISSSLFINQTYIYVGGIDRSAGEQWRIEKRNLSDGLLVWSKISSGSGNVRNSAAVISSSSMYISLYHYLSGNYQWRIEKRNLNAGDLIINFGTNGIINSNPTNYTDISSGIAIDSSGFYVGGIQGRADGNYQWRIEKRSISPSYIDCSFKIFDGIQTITIACEPLGTLTSPLQIAKAGNTYGLVLVDPSDPNASKIRIKTSSGIKALKKFSALTETVSGYYYRNSTHTINGLNTNELGLTNTSVSNSLSTGWILGFQATAGAGCNPDMLPNLKWTSDISIRHSNGTETSLANNIASISSGPNFSGTKASSWIPPLTTLNSTDAIKVTEKIVNEANGTVLANKSWITSQLNSIQLNSTPWQFYRSIAYPFSCSGGLTQTYLMGLLYYGDSNYNTRIENISLTK